MQAAVRDRLAATAFPSTPHFNCNRASLTNRSLVLQSLSNALWALAKLSWLPPAPLMAALVAQAQRQLGDGLTLQGAANVLWAFGALEYHPGAPPFHLSCTIPLDSANMCPGGAVVAV